VHALAQCAHADVNKALARARWIEALNASLPPAVRVLRCQYVSDNFHARLSAKGKVYRYRIWCAPVLPPFEYRRAWHITRPLNFKSLKEGAKYFGGIHDFAGFAANRGKAEQTTIRTIYSVRVRQKGPCLTIEFDGDGFLYKMVRLIVGSLVKCALGKMRIEEITARLNSGQIGPSRGIERCWALRRGQNPPAHFAEANSIAVALAPAGDGECVAVFKPFARFAVWKLQWIRAAPG